MIFSVSVSVSESGSKSREESRAETRRRRGELGRKESQDAQRRNYFGVRHLDAALKAATRRRNPKDVSPSYPRDLSYNDR
jgi:hypothetical protein